MSQQPDVISGQPTIPPPYHAQESDELTLLPEERAAADALDTAWDQFVLGAGPADPEADRMLSALHQSFASDPSRARRIWTNSRRRAQAARRPSSTLGIVPLPMAPRDVLVAAALLLMVLTGAARGWDLPGTDSLGLSTASAEAAPEEPTATASATHTATATPTLAGDVLHAHQPSATSQLIFLHATGTPAVTPEATLKAAP